MVKYTKIRLQYLSKLTFMCTYLQMVNYFLHFILINPQNYVSIFIYILIIIIFIYLKFIQFCLLFFICIKC